MTWARGAASVDDLRPELNWARHDRAFRTVGPRGGWDPG